MKKIITLAIAGILGLSMVMAQTFSDDFESYTAGMKLGPQSPNWRTWSGAGGGADDVNVITTDNHTTGGTKSIYFSSTLAAGGPSDCVLPFNTTPLTTGQFNYTSWFKVPASKTAYFNFQGNATMGNLYTLDCWMNANGTIVIENTGTVVLSDSFPVNAWFELSIDVNLNSNSWTLLIDGISKGTWQNASNQIYAIDLYPADAAARFWVDDVSYNVIPYTLPTLNGGLNLIGVTNGLVGQQRNLSVKVRNLGTTAINSFDISLDQNGGSPVVQNVTGVNIASLSALTVNITTPFSLVSGANTFRAVISNVNGLGTDGDTGDDTLTTTLTPVTPAAGKMVVAEEGTGTWCQWCPRGAVYMDMMKNKYEGYFVGIAVHNADPMTVTIYDNAMNPLLTGYPGVLVDRGPVIDPLGIEQDFLQRIQIAPKALIVNGANYNSSTRQLDLSFTSTFLQAVSGNYRLAVVLSEDSVTGTTTAYNQANAYAGGAAGPMGGFELLPSSVPASLMNYNHVARAISPGFAGLANSYPATVNVNDIFTHNFTFFLPAGWDINQLHITGMIINPSGVIDNASLTTITEAVTNGFVSGILVTQLQETTNAPDAQFNLYPNPVADRAVLSLNLKKESTVQVAVYNIAGALVAKKDYGKLSGGMMLPVDARHYPAGMYFVNITIDDNTSVVKLLKQ